MCHRFRHLSGTKCQRALHPEPSEMCPVEKFIPVEKLNDVITVNRKGRVQWKESKTQMPVWSMGTRYA